MSLTNVASVSNCL
jgi:hypothetical protein